MTSLERLTAPTPGTEHLSPVPPSAASSVTAISTADEPQLPKGLGLDKSVSDTGRTPVILENITSGLSANSFDNTNGVSSIWGGISAGTTSTSNNASTSVAGIPLAGLPSLSLASAGSTGSALGPRSDLGGDGGLAGGLGGGWGASNLGGSNSNKGGSIW